MPEEKTIYGDGTNEVVVTEKTVEFLQRGQVEVSISRAAFREIVLGWERLSQEEASA